MQIITLGRLEKVFAKPLDDTKPATALAEYSYWPTGQVKDIMFDNGRTVSHTINDRDWITNINEPATFDYTLDYDLSGNINQVNWKIDTNMNESIAEEDLFSYLFTYDNLYRLKSAQAASSLALSASAGYKYDKNGNILGLRRGSHAEPPQNYFYASGTNKLQYISGQQATNNYLYDYNGNLVMDLSKQILTSIPYDHRNLPYKILTVNGEIRHGYDGTGQRVIKKTITAN